MASICYYPLLLPTVDKVDKVHLFDSKNIYLDIGWLIRCCCFHCVDALAVPSFVIYCNHTQTWRNVPCTDFPALLLKWMYWLELQHKWTTGCHWTIHTIILLQTSEFFSNMGVTIPILLDNLRCPRAMSPYPSWPPPWPKTVPSTIFFVFCSGLNKLPRATNYLYSGRRRIKRSVKNVATNSSFVIYTWWVFKNYKL